MQVLAPVYGLTDAGDSARRLVAAGVDGVFTFEGPHDVFLPLALAAAASPGTALMTNVAIAFPRNAVHLAHSAWDLHELSGGRFTLGLGAQIRTHVERRFGEGFDRPADRMRETVGAVRAVFRSWQFGEPLRFEGEFRRHTLMTPMFSPQPSPLGPPSIAVGGLGPRMCAVAAEAADALAVMPVTSERFFADRTLPAVGEGLARRDASLGELEVLPELIVCCGRDEAEQAAADAGCRALLGFYSSTPAYRPVLDHEGFGDIQPVAQQMTREGRWDELTGLVPDELLRLVCVRGTPAEVAATIGRRYGDHASRVCVYLPYDASDELWGELVEALHAA
ncbi:MAG: TIGR03617 family F420-dependent LLM class oxidoreductase [Microthrixaceae bacterium]